MKFNTKIVTFLSPLGLVTFITFVAATLAVAQPSEVWIDDNYCNSCSNDGHTWDYDAFDSIQDGINAVTSPGTVNVAAGIYEEKVYLKEEVFLQGDGIGKSIIDGDSLDWEPEEEMVSMASRSKLSGFSVVNGGGIGVECFGISAIIDGNYIGQHVSIGVHIIGSGSSNSIVTNNIVIDCGGYGGIFGNSVYGSPQIIHNTVVGNSTAGIGFCHPGTPIIKNNIVVRNGAGIDVCPNTEPNNSHNNSWNNVSHNWGGCAPGEGAISENPLFVNAISGDYHLRKDSPCIDAGMDVGLYVDMDGDVRPFGAGFDMGADEFVPSYIEVDIDIKPGSCPNSINLKSKGNVTVAIISTDDFDAYDVDPVSCEFAGAYPLRWKMEDVNDDGYHDMLFHFMTRELVDLNLNSTEATLYGETFNGVQITGTDSVKIVPKCKWHGNKGKWYSKTIKKHGKKSKKGK